jgi:hypothetical protein
MSFQNLVRLSQILKKSPSDFILTSIKCQKNGKKNTILMFHNRAFSIASKNDIDDLLLATVLTIWLKQIIRNQFVIEKINTYRPTRVSK